MTAKRIKKATFEIVSKKGYEGMTLSEIAEMVGIKKPSIYAHFSSKEEIFFNVLEEEINDCCAYIDKIYDVIKNNNTEKILVEILNIYIEYFYQDPIKKRFWRNMLFCPCCSLEDKIKSKMIPLHEKIYDNLFYMMNKGMNNGEIKKQNIKELIYSFECLIRGNFTMLLCDQFTVGNLEKSWDIYWNGIKII